MASGESKTHELLRLNIMHYIKEKYNASERLIQTDAPGEIGETRTTPKLSGSYPDVYYLDDTKKILLIGEAKAKWDDFLENGMKKQTLDFIKDITYKDRTLKLNIKKIIFSVNKDWLRIARLEIQRRFPDTFNLFEII